MIFVRKRRGIKEESQTSGQCKFASLGNVPACTGGHRPANGIRSSRLSKNVPNKASSRRRHFGLLLKSLASHFSRLEESPASVESRICRIMSPSYHLEALRSCSRNSFFTKELRSGSISKRARESQADFRTIRVEIHNPPSVGPFKELACRFQAVSSV